VRRVPRPVELLGLASGWLVCLLLDRLGVVGFAPPAPGSAIPNWCMLHGYPKAADWFWYAALPLAGVAGAWVAARGHARLRRAAGTRRLPNLALWPVPVALGLAGALLFSRTLAGAPGTAALAMAGMVWPWVSRRWYAQPEPPPGHAAPASSGVVPPVLAAAAVVVAAGWVIDPCLRTRSLDLLHEGAHLLYAQSWLAGDLGGSAVRTEYGPLYTRSIIAWMRGVGFTALSLREYFLVVQAAGMALALVLLPVVCRTRTGLGIGAWLLLTASCAGPYGWANVLRVSLPLASVVLLLAPASGPRTVRAILSGILAAVAVGYSPEFGTAGLGAIACGALVAGRNRPPVGRWAVAAAVTAGIVWFAVGWAGAPGGGYPLARLAGHAARPLPAFRWPLDSAGLEPLWRSLSIWGPALLAGSTLAHLLARPGTLPAAGGPLRAGLAVFVLLSLLPAVARPLGQQAMSAPAWIVLAVIKFEDAKLERRRAAAAFAGIALAGWGLVAPDAGARGLLARWTCTPPARLVSAPAEYRLGGLMLDPDLARFLDRVVPEIRRLCPPNRRILLVAPSHLALTFLADRAALAPFPESLLAVTGADRRLLIEAAERDRPPVAVVTPAQLDIGLPDANPELLAYLRAHYRPVRAVDRLLICERRE